MADENLITDDDWAAAMQEQAAVEESGDSEADRVAAELAAAAMGDSPYQARPASQIFEDFGAPASKPGALNDFDMILDIPVQITVELGRTKLSIRNLLQLAHGSVVELDGLAGEPMDVLVERHADRAGRGRGGEPTSSASASPTSSPPPNACGRSATEHHDARTRRQPPADELRPGGGHRAAVRLPVADPPPVRAARRWRGDQGAGRCRGRPARARGAGRDRRGRAGAGRGAGQRRSPARTEARRPAPAADVPGQPAPGGKAFATWLRQAAERRERRDDA